MEINGLLFSLNYLSDDIIIKNIDLTDCGSDRGNYDNFCIGENIKNDGITTVKEIKNFLTNEVLSKTFKGYKGGDFEMGEWTIVTFGMPDCGGSIIDGLIIKEDGVYIKIEKVLYY